MQPSETSLLGPRLKIERANCHILELNQKLGGFFQGKPYRVLVETDPKAPQWHIWVVRVREKPPSDLATIVGDIVHNLFSALDLLACAAVRANGRGISDVCFPFAENANGVATAIDKAGVRKASPQVIAVFERLETYPGGKHEALLAIKRLDRDDKHRSIMPIAKVASFNERLINSITGDEVWPGLASLPLGPLEDGIELMRYPPFLSLNKKPGDEVDTSFHIVFGENDGSQPQPLIPTLKQYAQLVEGVVDAFSSVI
jgi:hypothetical protein